MSFQWLVDNWAWFAFTVAFVVGGGVGFWFAYEHDRRTSAEQPVKGGLTHYEMQQATVEVWLVLQICKVVIFCGVKRERLVKALREQATTDDVMRENFVLKQVAAKLEQG